MPFTLYKYILRELLKLLGLTTLVLVVVMSFAAAVRPMSDGLLSPGLLIKFLLFTAPTVLGFALPFAGAFASTLVFIRMASDNEVLACSASGIGYAKLLAPVLALGLLLTGGLLLLSNEVVPGFYRAAERTVEKDAVSLMVTQLNKNQPFVLRDQDMVVYADAATEFPPVDLPDSVLPMTQFVELRGVAVGQTDAGGRIVSDITAERAVLMVFSDRETETSYVRLNLTDLMRYDPATGGLGRFETLDSKPIPIPSSFSDNTKFFSSDDLDRLEQQPERFDSVRERMQELLSALATESLRNALVQTRDHAVLHGVFAGDRYVLSAPQITEDGATLRLSGTPDRPVTLSAYTNGRTDGTPDRRYTAASGVVRVRTNAFSPEPTINLELANALVSGRADAVTVGNKSLPFPKLSWPAPIFPEQVAERSAADLVAAARADTFSDSPQVIQTAASLEAGVAGLRRSVHAQRNERAAAAVSCSLLLLVGAVLSIRLRGQMALVVYFWSFMLAIVTLIIINSGVNVARGTDASLGAGLAVVWSGNTLLAAVAAVVYLQLRRT